jgi:hypothetical protein
MPSAMSDCSKRCVVACVRPTDRAIWVTRPPSACTAPSARITENTRGTPPLDAAAGRRVLAGPCSPVLSIPSSCGIQIH